METKMNNKMNPCGAASRDGRIYSSADGEREWKGATTYEIGHASAGGGDDFARLDNCAFDSSDDSAMHA